MEAYTTIQEAQAHPGVVHIHRKADNVWEAYEAEDTLPTELTDGLTDEQRAALPKG